MKKQKDPIEDKKNNELALLSKLIFRQPNTKDGYEINQLIKNCSPLDQNSAYCNLLQCSHFSESCIIAEIDNKILGWISGYQIPNNQKQLFIWQVAVHPDARGLGVAKKMLENLLNRENLIKINFLNTTITENNKASWSLFKGFALSKQTKLVKTPFFEKKIHFNNKHETEFLVSIGPFDFKKI